MIKFLHNIKKQQVIFFVVFFAFLGSILFPSLSSAVNGGPAMDSMSVQGVQNTYDSIKNSSAKEMGYILDGVTFAAGYIFLAISYVPQKLGRILLEWVMSKDFMSVSFTHITGADANPIVVAGWPMMRDLANMFVVLGFVIIGIATILRLREYEAKKLLPTLIVVALLINFSLVICGIFIDASNIALKSFSGSGNYTANSWSESLQSQANTMEGEKTATGRLTSVAGIVFFNIMAAVVFLLFFFLMMGRYIALWILVMFSPLAFVCYAFPFTKKIWDMWWSNFFAWCIVGIPAVFFLWTADVLTQGIYKSVQAQNPGQHFGIPLTDYMIPGILLLMGFLFSLKVSAMGSGAAIGAFKWTGGKIMGATGKSALFAGKGLADKSGATGLVTDAKDRATRALERMSLIKPGTTNMNQAARLNDKKRQDRVNNMSTDDMVRKLSNPRRGRNATQDRTLMTQRMAKENTLGRLDAGVRQERINEAIASGGNAKELIKSLSTGDIANIANNPATYPQFNEDARTEGVRALIERNELHRILPAERARVVAEVERNGVRIGDLAKSHYEFREYDSGDNGRAAPVGSLNSDGITPNTNAIGLDPAIQEQLRTWWGSASGSQRRNINPAHISGPANDYGFVTAKGVTADSIADLRTANDAVKDSFREGGVVGLANPDMMNALDQAELNAAGNTREQNRIRGIRDEILNHIIW